MKSYWSLAAAFFLVAAVRAADGSEDEARPSWRYVPLNSLTLKDLFAEKNETMGVDEDAAAPSNESIDHWFNILKRNQDKRRKKPFRPKPAAQLSVLFTPKTTTTTSTTTPAPPPTTTTTAPTRRRTTTSLPFFLRPTATLHLEGKQGEIVLIDQGAEDDHVRRVLVQLLDLHRQQLRQMRAQAQVQAQVVHLLDQIVRDSF